MYPGRGRLGGGGAGGLIVRMHAPVQELATLMHSCSIKLLTNATVMPNHTEHDKHKLLDLLHSSGMQLNKWLSVHVIPCAKSIPGCELAESWQWFACLSAGSAMSSSEILQQLSLVLASDVAMLLRTPAPGWSPEASAAFLCAFFCTREHTVPCLP